MPFRQWIWKDQENKRLLIFASLAILVQFVIFKIFYPLPNYRSPDSYAYVGAALRNDFINMWAIGYSKFLWLFSPITRNHLTLVISQYLILEASICYFLFSIRYLFSPGKWMFRVLLALNILNPLIPHIGNFVISDGLFTTLSLIWFTQLMWLLYRPTLRIAIVNAFVLLAVFMVRYNALYFPIISAIIILFSHLTTRVKFASIGLIALLLGTFVGWTEHTYWKKTRTLQFSAFGGWEMAANGLYGYAFSDLDSVNTVPTEFRELHQVVNAHMDSIQRVPLDKRPDTYLGVYYMWDFNAPLKLYQSKHLHQIRFRGGNSFIRWAIMGPLYARYGRYLILHHPGPFIKHYLWPNLVSYYDPPAGFLQWYDYDNKAVDPVVVAWFRLKNDKLYNRFHSDTIEITQAFPFLLAITNCMFLISFFICLPRFKDFSKWSQNIIIWMGIIWVSNMVFSVFAAPIELRYQLFPMIITFCFLLLFVEYIIGKSEASKPEMVGIAEFQS